MDIEFENSTDVSSMLNEIEKEESEGKFQSLYWKPSKEGTTAIRFIAPLKTFNEKLFYQKHKIHYIGGIPYFCLAQELEDKDGNIHHAETCPFCQKSKQIYSTSERGTPEWTLANSLRAKDRYVSRVIVRGKKGKNGENAEAYPEFWEFGQKIHSNIFETLKQGECGDFWSLKNGRDYNLVKRGTGRNTDYSGSSISFKSSPIFSSKEDLEILCKELPKMKYSKLVEFKSADELKKVLANYLSEDSEEVEETSTTDPLEDAIYGSPKAANKEAPADNDLPDDISAIIDSI